MSEIRICGYRPLSGEINVQGSKNGVLPMLAVSLLQRGTMRFTNVPIIQDVACMVGILESVGCRCWFGRNVLSVDASGILGTEIPKADVKKMRSSILVMGALLGRMGKAGAWYPGGCSIGSRPVDLHLLAFSGLGASVKEEDGRIEAWGRMEGGRILFPFPSVGATENALLASVMAAGETEICGAAKEPEVIGLCSLLRQMGALIEGDGTDRIRIKGGRELHETEYAVPGDRIAAGTYLTAVTAAGGDAVLWGAPWESMETVIRSLRGCGADIEPIIGVGGTVAGAHIRMEGRPKPARIRTGPYPEFPTDLQSPMLSVLSLAEGESVLTETVFEARFKTAGELVKMGADISVSGNQAMIRGRERLSGTRVRAWDLRGGAALVAAGLAASGETVIEDCIHIERGYEDICRDFQFLGGDICWSA